MRNTFILCICLVLITIAKTNAQVFINESFKTNTTNNNVVFGGIAKLTATATDSTDGWLQLTDTGNSKYGYAFIDQPFPSTLGTITEFEFKAWRDKDSNYSNGDGFSIFLFDGSVTKNDFRIGAYGGSLGYTKNSDVRPVISNGLKGGFIALGFDSYGGFGNSTEGKNGPDIVRDHSGSAETPNSIILRGATDENNPSLSNLILDYKKLGDRTKSTSNIRNNGELSYNVVTQSRPSDHEFYRKVKIEITPATSNNIRKYRIKVFMIKNVNDDYSIVPEIDYLTTQPLPETLKIGFAASTGGAINYHEIRNLKITTVGNLSVINNVDKNLICKENRSEEVEFKINVNNPINTLLSDISIHNVFLNSSTNQILDNNMLEIISIVPSSNISFHRRQQTPNEFEGSFSLAPSSIGTITVKVRIKQPNIEIKNIVNVSSNLIDSDLANNTSTEIVRRKICKVNTNPMLYMKSDQ